MIPNLNQIKKKMSTHIFYRCKIRPPSCDWPLSGVPCTLFNVSRENGREKARWLTDLGTDDRETWFVAARCDRKCKTGLGYYLGPTNRQTKKVFVIWEVLGMASILSHFSISDMYNKSLRSVIKVNAMKDHCSQMCLFTERSYPIDLHDN